MKKQMRHISYMQSLSYAELIEDIKSNVDESFFEPLMGRKYLQWIYYSRYFSDSEKKTIGQAIYGVLFDVFATDTWVVLIGAAAAALLISLYSKKVFDKLEDSK